MIILAYEYESMGGTTLRKAVICDTYEEYVRIKDKIKRTDGYRLIEFDHVFDSAQIPE